MSKTSKTQVVKPGEKELMRSKSFEGAMGSCSRLYPVNNCVVKGNHYHETSYGWEGEEIIERLNPSEVAVWRYQEEGTKSNLDEMFVALPTGEVYIRDKGKELWYQKENTEYGISEPLEDNLIPDSVINAIQ